MVCFTNTLPQNVGFALGCYGMRAGALNQLFRLKNKGVDSELIPTNIYLSFSTSEGLRYFYATLKRGNSYKRLIKIDFENPDCMAVLSVLSKMHLVQGVEYVQG
jgi:hypothetical protein